jgi:3-dehydroquinate synthetase
LIRHLELPTKLPGGILQKRILEKVFADKKFVNGRIRFVVSPKLGIATLAENITFADLEFGLSQIALLPT